MPQHWVVISNALMKSKQREPEFYCWLRVQVTAELVAGPKQTWRHAMALPVTSQSPTRHASLSIHSFPAAGLSQKILCILQLGKHLSACAGGSGDLCSQSVVQQHPPLVECQQTRPLVDAQINYGERMLILAVLPKGGAAAKNPECASPAPFIADMYCIHVKGIQLLVHLSTPCRVMCLLQCPPVCFD